MAISDSLLGFLIFLSLVCIGFTAVVVKERIRPSSQKKKSDPGTGGTSQAENYDSLGIQQRYIDQEIMMSADPRITGPDA